MSTVQVLADVEVLKCDIKAGIQKDTTNTTVVAYGKADQPAPRVTLQEVSNEFSGMIGEGDLDLPEVVANLELSLRQVYYKKVTPKGTDAAAAQDQKPSDYSLWLDLFADKITEGWPVKVNKVSIKVWQTTNEQILEDMEINAMKKLLN